ncbi:MAG: UbiA family prenyltransferase, partial [Candidatus Moraniibacteriota bacterium]
FQHFTRVSLAVASNMLLFGFLIILSPPIIDFFVSGGTGLWSFYIFDGFSGLLGRYLTFFGDRPDLGITYGVRVEVALVTICFGLYVFWKTRRVLWSCWAALSAYTLLFFLGTFPSWAALLIDGVSKGQWTLRSPDVAAIFLSPLSLFLHTISDPRSVLNIKMSLTYGAMLPFVVGIWLFFSHRKIFYALFRNARLPQAVYHAGLFFVGMGLSFVVTDATFSLSAPGLFDIFALFLLLVGIVSAWLASVVANDFFDRAIDCETNTSRPLPMGDVPPALYGAIGSGFFVASIFLPAIVNMKSALLLLVYQALAWVYSAPPFRLKRFPVVASFASAVASVLILFLGFMLFAPQGTIAHLPTSFISLFIFAYAVSIPLKDFKDVSGDGKNSVWTLPVLLGVRWAKLAVASGIFLSFIASVFVFHASSLFLPALLFGGASFWTVLSMKEKTGRITYRSVFWWILALVSGYGFLAVSVLL